MRIGIFFGGPSRERDVSFAGGRTALANLNKALFEPVLVFVSGLGDFYIVEPDFLENESIRAALPKPDGYAEIPVASIEPNPHQPRKSIEPAALAELAESIRAATGGCVYSSSGARR